MTTFTPIALGQGGTTHTWVGGEYGSFNVSSNWDTNTAITGDVGGATLVFDSFIIRNFVSSNITNLAGITASDRVLITGIATLAFDGGIITANSNLAFYIPVIVSGGITFDITDCDRPTTLGSGLTGTGG